MRDTLSNLVTKWRKEALETSPEASDTINALADELEAIAKGSELVSAADYRQARNESFQTGYDAGFRAGRKYGDEDER